MKNFLEHEDEVRYVDGFLAKSQEWQWFIDCVEENFDLDDVKSCIDFANRNNPLRKILANFIKILEVCDKDWKIKTDVCQDLFVLAKFSIGIISNHDCQDLLKSYMGMILYVVVWMTKLENQDNETQYIIDIRFSKQKNYWQAINMDSIILAEDKLIKYIESIDIDGFEDTKICLIENIKCISYPSSESFIMTYRDNLYSANAFNYQYIHKPDFLSWQEETLLDMLAVSLEKDKLLPTFSYGNSIVPDFTTWNSELLINLKEYFNDSLAGFVIETVDYIKNGKEPSKDVILKHCTLFSELLSNEEDFEIIASSTYTVLSKLFEDHLIKKVNGNTSLINMIKLIQQKDSFNLLLRLKADGFPLSKRQNSAIKIYIDEQYKRIVSVGFIHDLLDYLKNLEIAKHINQDYYNIVIEKFYEMIQNPRGQLLPSLFFQFMHFLLEVNHSNQNVDKRKVKLDMIVVQEHWQNKAYKEQCANLQEFKYSTTIATKDIDMFNEVVIANPILIAQKCMIAENNAMCDVIISMSEHAINYMFKKMILGPIYPMEGAVINYENHDMDKLLKEQVEAIKKECGYKFLNVMDTDVYVSGIHERYVQYASTTVPMFKEEERLYGIIEEQLEKKLIPYDSNIALGHLTQLFPLLEMQIRELGKMVGVVPFKEKASEFMKFKDPSSVLREILTDVYEELHGFENVPDLLFVYHFMYNGNSMNVRNECIHGRDYTDGSRLRYAFKITLLSLYMIIYRISIIKHNKEQE
ncbi:MAG: hypothetical protein ACYDEX_15910 [Mobilitalea sp.]